MFATTALAERCLSVKQFALKFKTKFFVSSSEYSREGLFQVFDVETDRWRWLRLMIVGHLESRWCVGIQRDSLYPDDFLRRAWHVPRIATERTVVPAPRRLVDTEWLFMRHGWLAWRHRLFRWNRYVFTVYSFNRVERRVGASPRTERCFLHFGQMGAPLLFRYSFAVVILIFHMRRRAPKSRIPPYDAFLRRHSHEIRRSCLYAAIFTLQAVA